jgi:hypothetical protein
MSSSVVLDGNLVPNLTTLSAATMTTQLTQHNTGRYLLWMQWALRQCGTYTDPIDGHWRPTMQTALDEIRGNNYDDGHGTYAPLTGPTVSKAFLSAFFADYLDTPDNKTVVA